MAILFLDSSAVVKRYVSERGSAWVTDAMSPASGNSSYIAVVAGAEIVAAITRCRSRGSISVADAGRAITEFADDWNRLFEVVNVDRTLVTRAMTLAETHGLRGYDAIQLSSALEVNAVSARIAMPLVFVSADDELNAAAVVEGLAVENPNLHP